MSRPFTLTRRIEFSETDMAGIVHFSNFFRFMEATEHAFLRELGLAVHSHDSGIPTGWPRVHASCDYLQPLRFEDEVEIELRIGEIRSSAVRYDFSFRKPGASAEIARGRLTAVHVGLDSATGRMAARMIPDSVRTLLQSRLDAKNP